MVRSMPSLQGGDDDDDTDSFFVETPKISKVAALLLSPTETIPRPRVSMAEAGDGYERCRSRAGWGSLAARRESATELLLH